MKKTFFLFLVFIYSINCYSQSKVDIAFQKVKSFYMTYSKQTKGYEYSIHYNKFDKTLDINEHTIPILYIKVKYNYVDEYSDNTVQFRCPDDSYCIGGPHKSEFGLSEAFKTKEQCYTFIDLLSDLKDAIEK